MPIAKKLFVVVSLLAIGTLTALFFRKDAAPSLSAWAEQGNGFREGVERRLPSGGLTSDDYGFAPATRPAATVQHNTFKVPAAAVAMEPNAAALPASYQRTCSPMGGLFRAPTISVSTEDEPHDESPAGDTSAADARPRTHQVVDGDTLSKLAEQYLGRQDRYLEIFELNRDVLNSPDLLPIGSVLKLPPRNAAAAEVWPAEAVRDTPPAGLVPIKSDDSAGATGDEASGARG